MTDPVEMVLVYPALVGVCAVFVAMVIGGPLLAAAWALGRLLRCARRW